METDYPEPVNHFVNEYSKVEVQVLPDADKASKEA